jgi:hypothetical protein
MAFTVPSTLPAAPAYGLPPNVIRASYALNLIQTDAFQFATSRRKVCNLFQISPLPAGSEVTVAEFLFFPLPTANGNLEIVLYGANVDVKLESLTSAVSTVTTATTDDVYTNALTGLTIFAQLMQIKVTDLGSGYIVGLFVFESALTAGDLP